MGKKVSQPIPGQMRKSSRRRAGFVRSGHAGGFRASRILVSRNL
jgi:hypothetical protein